MRLTTSRTSPFEAYRRARGLGYSWRAAAGSQPWYVSGVSILTKPAFLSSAVTTCPRVAWLTTSLSALGAEYMFSTVRTTTASGRRAPAARVIRRSRLDIARILSQEGHAGQTRGVHSSTPHPVPPHVGGGNRGSAFRSAFTTPAPPPR